MERKVRLVDTWLNFINKLGLNHLVLQNLPKLDNYYIHFGYVDGLPFALNLLQLLHIGNVGSELALFDKFPVGVRVFEPEYYLLVFHVLIIFNP